MSPILTLFGQLLRGGKWFLADEYGHRVPLQIYDAEIEDSLLYGDNKPFTFHNSVDIKASILHGSIMTKWTNSNSIKKVIFNNPATIVIWNDGTKTIVKCQEGDTYSKELGFAMCLAKKFLGNKGNFNDIFKKYLKE